MLYRVWLGVNFLYNSLCFGFVANRALLTLQCLAMAEGGLYSVKAFSFAQSALHSPQAGWVWAEIERAQWGHLTQMGQREIP